MSESEKPFTVRDRRHFTPDGQVREETEAEISPASSEPQPAPAIPVEDPPARDGAREPGAPASPVASPPDQGPASPDGFQAGPADFGQFLLSLGVQASALLTGEGLPDDADPGAVLDGARSLISILEMLRDKTEGRRTAQEEKILEGLLFELRMAYVEKTRAGGS